MRDLRCTDRAFIPTRPSRLRLAFGEAKGYTEGGEKIPWATTLGGTYEHAAAHNNKEPFELPKIWNERKSQLKLSTPFNFVSTADIIGGNSGSPVINRQGELVGIIFDGNIESLVLDYTYTDQVARAVAVHSAGILEALRKIYQANRLVDGTHGKEIASAFTEPIYTEYQPAHRPIEYWPPQQHPSCESVSGLPKHSGQSH